MGVTNVTKRKQKRERYWLFDKSEDLLMIGFSSLVEAERLRSKLKTQARIYEANTREEAWEEHKKFIVAWANGKVAWD